MVCWYYNILIILDIDILFALYKLEIYNFFKLLFVKYEQKGKNLCD